MLDLSVIVPIYNTPIVALERCFESIFSLEGCAYEVLLIDDGSMEPVGEFCKAFSEGNPQFRYFYEENGGVSSARNMGIVQAKGRYITFLDADDFLLGQPLVQYLQRGSSADVVVFDMLLSQRGSDTVWNAFPVQEGVISREQMLFQLITASSISGPCAKLYKRELVEDILFNTEFISGEDWMFVCDCVQKAQNFYYCSQPSYRYFRAEATGQRRVMKFPDKMLDNQLARYYRKQKFLEAQCWTEHTAQQVGSLASIELIENLFNLSAQLLLAKQYTTDRKKKIRAAVAEAGKALIAPVQKKTQLKLWVLTSFQIGLYPLACLRAVYLKLKG